LEAAVFSDVLESEREQLVKDNIIIMEADVNFDENAAVYKLSAKRVMSIEQARVLYSKSILLSLCQTVITQKLISQIQNVLKPYCHGHCPVAIHYQNQEAKAVMHLGQEWWVEPTDKMLKELRLVLGNEFVKVGY
jgi:DNA polymerase-3 subunit alpha